MDIVNWPLAKHPMNWVIIMLMLVIAGFVLHLVCGHYADVRDSPPTSALAQ
jgi:energy-converting hydrogenase Eha subunit C